MRRFVLILAAATAALVLFLLNAAPHATTQLLSAPTAAAPPPRLYNDTAERREAETAASMVAVNLTEINSTGVNAIFYDLLLNTSKTASGEHCSAQIVNCTALVSAPNVSAILTTATLPTPAAPGPQAVAAEGGAPSAAWPLHLAFGLAGVALYGYGLYLSACGGPVCRWRRFRAIAPLSAATVLISIALSAASPLFLAMATPGVWGLIHYYRARRRLALWLSSILT